MKVFISCDMEGTNGIVAWPETEGAEREYKYFQNKMNQEVLSICNGINKAGKKHEIFVKDAHDHARNIDHAILPENVVLNRGWGSSPLSMMFGIDNSFDAVIFSGYHNASGTNTNPLAHTMSASEIVYMKINGIVASEFLMNYYSSLYFGVPVVMVVGDKGLCDVVKTIDPEIQTVVTNIGMGNSTTAPHPNITNKALEEAAASALKNKDKVSIKMPKQFKVEIYYKKHQQATRHAFYPGAYAMGEHIVGFECEDYFEFLTFFMFR